MNSNTTRLEKNTAKLNIKDIDTSDRDGYGCKYKWTRLLTDYKKIIDFYRVTSRDEEYFNIGILERKAQTLEKMFHQKVYNKMDAWLRHKLKMNLLYMRDFMNQYDGNYVLSILQEESDGIEVDGPNINMDLRLNTCTNFNPKDISISSSLDNNFCMLNVEVLGQTKFNILEAKEEQLLMVPVEGCLCLQER